MPNSYYNYNNDFLPGTRVRSLEHDDQFSAIEAAFDLLGDPTELNNGSGINGPDAGVPDGYVVDNSGSATRTDGELVTFTPINTNTGPSTLALNGDSNRTIVRSDGQPLQAGDLIDGVPVFMVYDAAGDRWVLLSPVPSQFRNRPVIIAVSASREIALEDEGAILTVDTSAGNVTLTVPANATTAIPVGFITHLYNMNANDVVVASAGGVIVNNAIGPSTRATYSTISLVKINTNEWMLIGDAKA